MTFAGANLAEAEFNNVTFTSSAGTAQTFTMATRGLRWLTTLTVSDTSSTTALATADLALGAAADAADVVVGNSGILTANASAVVVNGVTMTGGTSGTITVTTGGWTVSGNWNTSGVGSTYTQGTSLVTFDATATITLLSTDNTFDQLTVSAGTSTLGSAVIVTNALTISGGTFAKSTFAITSAGSLTMSGGDLTSTSGAVTITGAVNISSAASAITFGSEAWTVSGTWTNASTDGAVWDKGTGTVTFTSATGGTMTFAGANLSEDEFNNVTLDASGAGGQTFTMATRGLRWGGTLTIQDTAGGGWTTLNPAALGMAGGALSMVDSSVLQSISGGTNTFSSVSITGTANTMQMTSGSITVTGNFTIGAGTHYVLWGSGSHTISGTYSNSSTNGTNWSAGTGTVTFNSATGGTMTFGNLSGSTNEFNNVTFTSSAGTAQTFTMATNGLRWGGTLTVSDTSGGTTLAKTTLTLTGGALSLGAGSTADALTSTSGDVSVTNVTVAAFAFIDLGSEAWTVSGTWTNNTGAAGWEPGTGTVTFTSATGGSMTFPNLSQTEFFNATFTSSAGTSQTFTMIGPGQLTYSGTLTITDTSGGTILDKVALSINNGLTGRALTISGTVASGLVSTSGAVLVSTVSVSTATAYIDFGSEAWSVTGTWTNATTSASWDAGTGTVTFSSATGGTMTFAGANLAEDEFNNVTFTSSAGTAQTFTMATRGLRWGGTLTVTDTSGGTTLAKATLGLTGGALTISGAAASGLTSTSGAVTVTTVSISTATAFIDFGSEAWIVSGSWTNSTTSASWDAGTGSMQFSSGSAVTMTFAGTNLSEAEFADARFSGNATFTLATRGLRVLDDILMDGSTSANIVAATDLNLVSDAVETNGGVGVTGGSILDWINTSATLRMGTGDLLGFTQIHIHGVLTMDGITVGAVGGTSEFMIDGCPSVSGFGGDCTGTPYSFDVTQWTLFTIAAGLPDVRWTMNPANANANIIVSIEALSPTTTFAIYRDNVDILEVGSNASGLLVFSGGAMNNGWSSHTMIINLPGLTFGAGGGGGGGGGGGAVDPTVSWTWRHLTEDLTVSLVVTSPLSAWKYEWYIGDRKIGEGPVLEYTFERSGTWMVTLKAIHPVGRAFLTNGDVIAKSIAFVGRYMPLLLLLVLAIWYFMLVAASDPKRGPFVSDGGKLGGMFFGIALLAVAGFLLSRAYFTVPLGSFAAIRLYAGVALVAAVGPLRNRFIKLVAFGIGIALLAFGYLSLVPSL